jgi:serine protease AprX
MTRSVHRLPSRLLIALASIAALVTMSVPAAAGSGTRNKLDRALQAWKSRSASADQQRVIVHLKPGARAAFLQRLKTRGAQLRGEHAFLGDVTIDVPRRALQVLEEDDDIESMSIDAPVTPHASPAPTGAVVRSTLGLVSNGPTGSGVGVAVIDSGISSSNAFGDRITAFYDFTGGSPVATSPKDPYGHGTHVAGLIAASGSPSGNLYPGIAPGANLIGLRVLDNQGMGYTSTVIAAIEFATANRQWLGIDVINLSLGHPVFESASTDPLAQAVEAAVRAGIVVIASAGNYGLDPLTGQVGYAGVTSPGIAPSAITVGAVDTMGTVRHGDDTIAPYSSRGPTWYDGRSKPDVVAPGHQLTAVGKSSSNIYVNYPSTRVSVPTDYNNKYLRLCGTSMAAAVTSGVVAVMIDAHRQAVTWTSKPMTPNTVKAILQYSAIELTDPATGRDYNALTQGAGEINADGAIDLAQLVDPSRPLGMTWIPSQPWPYSVFGGQYEAWSQHLVWGTHLVWGNSLFYHERGWDASSAWGVQVNHLVWGNLDPSDLVWNEHLVWGNHIVWGNALVTAIDAEHIVWGNLDPNASVLGNADLNLADNPLDW